MLPSRKVWQTKVYTGRILVRVVRSENAPQWLNPGVAFITVLGTNETVYVSGGTVIAERVDESSPLPPVAPEWVSRTK
jgi:hypothetical protein